MIENRLRQLKNKDDELFGGVNIIVFGDLFQLPPVKGHAVFEQPNNMKPNVNLWRTFSLCELKQNMRQQGDKTFIDILNALRVGEMNSNHLNTLLKKVSKREDGQFSIERAIRIYPTNDQVKKHNKKVLRHFRKKRVEMYTFKAQDQIIDSTKNLNKVNIDNIISKDINKTAGLPTNLTLFVGAKVMIRSNIDVSKGLVNGAIGNITEIIWPNFRRGQMYETDIPSVRIDLGKDGIHLIKPVSLQFPAMRSYGTAERRMLPLILAYASTVHKMQGCTVDFAVIYLGSKIFKPGQAYVALSRVRSLEGVRIEELDCYQISGKKPCNLDALREMNRLRGTFNDFDFVE